MKKEFPILNNISYLDNAATTQKPISVIKKIKEFYETSNANTHRGLYDLSVKSTKELEDARQIISKFINAKPKEIFFVKNATEGFNVLARTLEKNQGNIVTTIIEHHSNLAPWIETAKRTNTEIKIAKKHPLEQEIISLVDDETNIVTLSMMSNVTGLTLNTKDLIKKIREKNPETIIILDAAQSIAHQDIDVKELDCDYLIFSGHKIYGPLGTGVVYGKEKLLEKMQPTTYGGGMITDFKEEFIYNEAPQKFEAGTIDVASIAGLGEALKFFSKQKNKYETEKELKEFALKEMNKIQGLKIIGHEDETYGPIISFDLKNIHPHDVASIADTLKVCIRAGHHCAKPYIKSLGYDSLCRASISFYNDKEDIIKLIDAIKKAKVIFNE